MLLVFIQINRHKREAKCARDNFLYPGRWLVMSQRTFALPRAQASGCCSVPGLADVVLTVIGLRHHHLPRRGNPYIILY